MEVTFLKEQSRGLAMREVELSREREDLLLSQRESLEVMVELRREMDSIREESQSVSNQYNRLVVRYRGVVAQLEEERGM